MLASAPIAGLTLSFNDLVRPAQERTWHFKPKRLRRLKIDNKLIFFAGLAPLRILSTRRLRQ